MKATILNSFRFNLMYAQRLVDDVPDDKWCAQPAGIPNHPAWVIGHLAVTSDFALKSLGGSPACPEAWGELFANGTTPVADAAKYPDKATLLQALEDGHGRVAAALEGATDAQLTAKLETGPKELFPTVGDLASFIMMGHEATHLGQLSAWRRAAGLGSVF